ncbi:DUF4232 domain-containing protein [Streptomyces sp. NRRL B-1677]|uniref:DUF4232 domain-containing protein n=1 Tax=Streptomyces TaxID=1883 RepID=UPI0018929039|nr:DUF4232 domain-containing protein [Streptomyces sp. NRRL B-1677]MBF6048521.1 DUF4232 domain-containing protein [Streptomyces sp. NRRL B-1677]
MSGNRRKAILVSAALVGGTLLMTACQDTDADAAKGSSSAPAADKPATSPGASTTGGNQGSGKDSAGKDSAGKDSSGKGTAAGGGSGANGKVGKCRTDDLEITASDSTITGDTDGTVAVTLKNLGHDCAISGFAGVDLKTSAGSLSAKRTAEKSGQSILKSDKSVSFGITYPVNNSGGSGVRITGLRVTPPNETKSVTLNWPGAATLPVTEDGGSPVKVGPIGSAGQGGAQ